MQYHCNKTGQAPLITHPPPCCFTVFFGKREKKLHVTCDSWQVTCDTWHVTLDMFYVVGGEHFFSHFLLISSHGLGKTMFWKYFRDKGDKGVCRTYPAKPYLLKKIMYFFWPSSGVFFASLIILSFLFFTAVVEQKKSFLLAALCLVSLYFLHLIDLKYFYVIVVAVGKHDILFPALCLGVMYWQINFFCLLYVGYNVFHWFV